MNFFIYGGKRKIAIVTGGWKFTKIVTILLINFNKLRDVYWLILTKISQVEHYFFIGCNWLWIRVLQLQVLKSTLSVYCLYVSCFVLCNDLWCQLQLILSCLVGVKKRDLSMVFRQGKCAINIFWTFVIRSVSITDL